MICLFRSREHTESDERSSIAKHCGAIPAWGSSPRFALGKDFLGIADKQSREHFYTLGFDHRLLDVGESLFLAFRSERGQLKKAVDHETVLARAGLATSDPAIYEFCTHRDAQRRPLV